ncbi:MAG TPA: GNAT family N-acetyltransferase [Acidimicrobiales bacterium]|nr:GNAT family N-acetyltransferase [Acidimicrobiales bacterium]
MILRAAVPSDVPALVELIEELAAYEREPDAVEVDAAMLSDALFAEAPVVFATVADDGGAVVGTAIHFRNFSTWTGRVGIYLEDLYVRPGHRGRGIGRALLAHLAQTARDRGYARVDWSVLDWNEPALAFYRSIGARPMTGWTGYRLDGDALAVLAQEGQGVTGVPADGAGRGGVPEGGGGGGLRS